MQQGTLPSAVVRKDPLPRRLKIVESDSDGQPVLHVIWILGDIKAKAIVMACSTTLQLPGRRATDDRGENVTPTW